MKNPEEKAERLMGKVIRTKDACPESAVVFLDSLLNISPSFPFYWLRGCLTVKLGIKHWRKKDFAVAHEYALRALKSAKNEDEKELAVSLLLVTSLLTDHREVFKEALSLLPERPHFEESKAVRLLAQDPMVKEWLRKSSISLPFYLIKHPGLFKDAPEDYRASFGEVIVRKHKLFEKIGNYPVLELGMLEK
ncbi:hypothetical protein DRQ18_01610 [bacterium]|nr:MAG: hypothetical protein DRQ18_01610 [bacterium]